MIEVKEVEAVVVGFLNQKPGYFLVEATVKGNNVITVVIDHDELPIDLDTIVELTRYIEERLDREKEDFELEVSSAGLTTPLESPRRYQKFIGKPLEVILKSGIKERGTLIEADDEGFKLEVVRMLKPEGARRKQPTPEMLSVSYDEVKRAVYMIEF